MWIIDASNYVTEQHNALSEWLYDNLCIIYKASGGSCESVIGPLQENQAHIPMQLYWPEGQPSIMEKIDLIQTSLPLTLKDNLELEHIINANTSSADGLKTIKGKMDALSSNLQENLNHVDVVDGKVDAVDGKVDAVESKVNAVESKVDALSKDMQDKVNAVESKVDALSNDMRDKVDAVESKVDALSNDVRDKVGAVQEELRELKYMMTKLMEMIAN